MKNFVTLKIVKGYTMKKFFYTLVFLSIPSLVWAIECNSPKICTLKASDVCTNKKLKLLGTDECVECVCPDGQTEVSDGTCCKHSVATKANGEKICCSSDQEVVKETVTSDEICCRNDKVYDSTENKVLSFSDETAFLKGNYLQPKDRLCCKEGTVIEYETYDEDRGREKIKQCCLFFVNSGDPNLPMISINGVCRHGCLNNWDCNLNWAEGDVIHYCQSDHTCSPKIEFDISGIEVEINDFAGGKFTREKAEALVKKIREDLLASTGNDKVKIVFSGEFVDPYLSKAYGYSTSDDKLTIHIDTGFCAEKSGGEFECQATIVHENVHRVDRLVQPKWREAHRVITDLYQSCLTEIHAQARGALTKVRAGFESCYRYKDGRIWPVCAPLKDFDPADCTRCKGIFTAFDWGEKYAGKYMNYGDAKKYYTDPAWSQDNNCNGLQGQLEEDFTNSPYAERVYWSERREEAKAILDQVTPTVLNAVHKVKEASSLDQGLFGMISRTGLLWDSTSPNLVSDIARLYSEHATLCMSPDRFMNHPALKFGFESISNIPEFEQAYDFIQSNPVCQKLLVGDDVVSTECKEILNCIGDEWRNGCWPDQEWASYIGQIETYTIN